MRGIIQEKLAAGESREQIIQYFVDRYGEGVLVEPPKRGFSLLVWLGPLLALAAGGVIVAWTLRSRRRAAAGEAETPLPGPGTLPDDPALARHVRRVRELAYGWPDGRPPGSAG